MKTLPSIKPHHGRVAVHSHPVSFMISKSQRADLNRGAKRLEITLSQYLRLVLFNEMPVTVKKKA